MRDVIPLINLLANINCVYSIHNLEYVIKFKIYEDTYKKVRLLCPRPKDSHQEPDTSQLSNIISDNFLKNKLLMYYQKVQETML